MNLQNFALCLVATSVLVSCGDKKKDDVAYSKLSIEQHKENFVESGLTVIDDLNGISELEGLHAMEDFFFLMESEPDATPKAFANKIKPLLAYGQGSNKMLIKSTSAEEYRISTDYDKEKGVYTYNKVTGEFVKTTGNDIVYKFPIGNSTTNNGELAITNFTYVTKTYSDFDGTIVEQPTALNITLKKGTTILMDFEFLATYEAKGFPTLIKETYNIGDYAIVSTLKRSNSQISHEQSFMKSARNILSTNFSTNGNYSYDNIVDATTMENPYDQDVFSSANASVAVGNYKIEGSVSWKGLKSAIENMDAEDEEGAMKKMATAMNKNIALYVKYNDNNDVIATSQFYAYKEVDDYWNEEYWNINMRMKFGDGSVMDGSFFDQGMDELIKSAEELFSSMETSFAE
jgi:uncharacterized phage-associated protein